MAKWRELGEVPDSDEESLYDSTESQLPALPPPIPDIPPKEPPAEAAIPQGDSIWDLPSSSVESLSIQSTEIQPTLRQRRIEIHIPAKSIQQEPESSPLSSPEPSDEDVTDPNPNDGQDHTIEQEDGPAQIEQEEAPSRPDPEPDTTAELISPIYVTEDDEVPAQRELVQFGRSLRPRKPIQEHPYLLENAQYSTLFKSHGVRPVRLPPVAEKQPVQEEDSQERDYEDDSQLTLGNGQEGRTEESQEVLQGWSYDEDRDELALSSPSRLSVSPRQPFSSQDISTGSQNDEELPSLGDLFNKRLIGRPKTYAKRRGSPKQSSKRKAPKLQRPVQDREPRSPPAQPFRVFDVPPSPPQTSPALTSTTPAATGPKARHSVNSLTPKLSSTNASRDPTPAPANGLATTVDLKKLPDLESEDEAAPLSDGEQASENHAASSSPEPNTALQRRIKGVLPASWIRLDQQLPHGKARKPVRRSPDRSPERANRKGVAQRRQVSPNSINDAPFFFDNDSDDDDTNLRSNDIPGIPETTRFSVYEDDVGSVMEEDFIDHMLPGRKRAITDLDGKARPAIKKLKKQRLFNGQPGVPKRQQRLTGMVNQPKSGSLTNKRRPAANIQSTQLSIQRPLIRQATPPRLSILDVVEANAPRFIKIAARAASRRPDQGKSSPSRKHISLGSRQDNVEVLGVLRDWERGLLQSSSTAKARYPVRHEPLQPTSDNDRSRVLKLRAKKTIKTVALNPFSRSRKLVKQTSIDRFADTRPAEHTWASRSLPDEAELPTPAPVRRLLGRSKTHAVPIRAAQLETVGGEQVNRRAFHSQKKVLDSMYRRIGKEPPSGPEAQLEQVFRGQVPKPGLSPPETDLDHSETSQVAPRKSLARQRKSFQPRQINIAAPQYAHANDPLPEDRALVADILQPVAISGEHNSKLLGLGPYGTHYTQHFEVFPLDDDVFFHESTLIGQGKITKAFDDKCVDGLTQPRGQCVLILGGQPLRWDQWDAQISSEFGVLFDWIADKLQSHSEVIDIDDSPACTATQATDFSLHYLQEFINLPDTESGRLFVLRILEVISGFSERLESSATEQALDICQAIIVMPRVLLVVLQALRVCEKLGLTESLQVEVLLRKTATQMARLLLRAGLTGVTSLFDDLQAPAARSRGIRNEHYSVIAWVTLIRVLQECRIPRSSFWDVVSLVMLEPGVSSVIDAQDFERLWCSFFTILPLGEFDNAGAIVASLRHTIPLEGWSLAQKMLSRVFELYRTNQRQSPSFNDYCRALVGRCHYLVEQWGWRKCSSIIGTIFDFFASQNLSHLRNEEAYKSPQFLGELAGSPSLAVQPEDRCFHIFLKLLALSIQQLRKLGLIKDVKNLIARVLPNHDRQYLKERDIHENELASLRNHHDLLCTLFWCSPQALRPSVQTLEKLVIPGSSHKEACLINLRAWNQLARFVVSNGEDRTVYKPLADWQNNVFKQVLDQYSLVESDIQQQFLNMSKDAPDGVSPELMKRVINMNKQAATDVLHFSLRANLDVMRHAKSLAAASLIMNTYQLHEVFTRFCLAPPDFDWGTQSAAVEVVDHFNRRIETFMEELDGSQSSIAWHGEDAIMLLDRHVSVPFFSMTQKLLANPSSKQSTLDNERVCVERTVLAASRLAALFLRHGVTRITSFFSSGKYGLFKKQSAELSLYSRRYFCLFITILIERGVADFGGINATPLELFLCAIAKPYQALAYEYRLAEALKGQGEACLKDFVVPRSSPDYGSNRDSFDSTLSLMRRTVRFAAVSKRPQLQQEFSKALKSVMDQMKADLKSIIDETSAHLPYVQFVRMIIPLIKKHDFCPVDNFFYQISSEYSPSSQDPRLQTAQILSYGLKLEDGDTRSLSTLFYFLYSNFKLAMTNGKTDQERAILCEGVENQHVFSFMLGQMLPAVIKTSVRAPETWLLLKTYVGALDDLLGGFVEPGQTAMPYIHRAIGRESMGDLLALIKSVSAAVNHLSSLSITTLEDEYLHTLVRLVQLLNLFGPSIAAFSCLPGNSRSQLGRALSKEIEAFTDFTRAADEYISGVLPQDPASQAALQINPLRLLEEMQYYYVDPALEANEHINNFSMHMENDIQKNWYTTETIISVRGPPKPSNASTQSGQGTALPVWDAKQLVQELHEQLGEWNRAFDRSPAPAWRRRPVIPEDFLF